MPRQNRRAKARKHQRNVGATSVPPIVFPPLRNERHACVALFQFEGHSIDLSRIVVEERGEWFAVLSLLIDGVDVPLPYPGLDPTPLHRACERNAYNSIRFGQYLARVIRAHSGEVVQDIRDHDHAGCEPKVVDTLTPTNSFGALSYEQCMEKLGSGLVPAPHEIPDLANRIYDRIVLDQGEDPGVLDMPREALVGGIASMILSGYFSSLNQDRRDGLPPFRIFRM